MIRLVTITGNDRDKALKILHKIRELPYKYNGDNFLLSGTIIDYLVKEGIKVKYHDEFEEISMLEIHGDEQ
jgi:hypothetical protein